MTVAEPPVAASPEWAGYAPRPGVFDECVEAGGGVRPHYQTLLQELRGLGAEEVRRRVETSRRLLHEQGAVYNAPGALGAEERPWQLDPVPFILAPDEWSKIESALIQRAELINEVLADCYGPQSLIRSGRLPPALVFAQPDFLRPCHGIEPPNGVYLDAYAADLARSPDGRWWVVSDRTQIPTGAGYALANRLVASRVFPEAFRECNVHRLAGFFMEFRHATARHSHRAVEDPRVVVLSPGPYSETYFEQTWLARYLGYMMVEGQDLTVRDDRVFLKTLSGLEPVDVILRRVDDDFCDPLELRGDSMLGVPGLVEALRARSVAVVNALGTGVLQSPAFLAFLPGLCRHLRGEDLLMPSTATWWCGQAAARQYVLEHLEELVVKPAFRRQLMVGGARERPGAGGFEALRKAIRFQPHLFAGQERVPFSTAPAWTEEGFRPRSICLRVYLVRGAGGYRVMRGGLARVGSESSPSVLSMIHGGSTKDAWVLSSSPVEQVTLLQSAGAEVELRRVGNNLPSSMADDFFWLGRYAERMDVTARLLRSALVRMSPENVAGAWPVVGPILDALESQGQIQRSGERGDFRQNAEALEAELLGAIFDPERTGSLRDLAGRLDRLALILRHRTSSDLWRALSQIDDRLARPPSSRVLLAGDAVGVINQTLLGLAAFNGLARENMTRAQGWRFLDMGHRIERGLHLCGFLNAALSAADAANSSLLEAVLEVCDSTITYRSRYNLMPHIAAVYDLVLLDDTNPRSLLFQLAQLVKHFDRLPRERESALPTPAQRILLRCVARLRLLDPRELRPGPGSHRCSQTAEVIQATLKDLPSLSDAIAVTYFAHSTVSRTGAPELA